MADANISIVIFSDILIKDYNILHYHRTGYGKALTKEINLQVYSNL
jgi:purine-nucleoside phosphorylase